MGARYEDCRHPRGRRGAARAGERRCGRGLAAAAVLLVAAASGLACQPPSSPSPAERRARLLAEATDLVLLDWSATRDPAAAGAEGDVAWSAERQEGSLLLRGLEANDPARFQYQLWIFDQQRDQRHPVDGGVFDVPAGGDERVVPFVPKLKVFQAVLFAVTVERPGGVVVSGRERIVLLARPSEPASFTR